jgi:hypothetical protein
MMMSPSLIFLVLLSRLGKFVSIEVSVRSIFLPQNKPAGGLNVLRPV